MLSAPSTAALTVAVQAAGYNCSVKEGMRKGRVPVDAAKKYEEGCKLLQKHEGKCPKLLPDRQAHSVPKATSKSTAQLP